jgi:hypothetical protein
MRKREVFCIASLAIAAVVAGCSDATSPASRAVLVPVPRVSKIQGPPDSTYSVSAIPLSQVTLQRLAWDTWVTLEPTGTVHLIAKPKLPGANSAYVESGDADASGIIDHHPGPCVLSLSVQDAYDYLPGFGDCGGPVKTDTLLSKRLQSPWITRGQLPTKHYYECSNDTNVCHSVDSSGYSTVRERPIPVILNKLRVNKHTSTFVTHEGLAFSASKSLDSIYIGARWNGVPMKMTFWQWIGADSTRNPVPPWTGGGPCYGTESFTCTYAPYESGRMIVKAFTGGWEQTSSVTVQCLMAPDDSAINDSTNDFSAREEILEARRLANVDSSATAGWTLNHPKGWKNETPGVLWRLPNGSGFQFVPYDDPSSTACKSHLPDSQFDAAHAPVPGATPYAGVHVHPVGPLGRLYGCDSTLVNGVMVPAAQFPDEVNINGTPLPFPRAAPESDTVAGSDDDWRWVKSHGRKMFIATEFGYVFRLDPPPGDVLRGPHLTWPATHITGSKCSWVKKYAE